MNAPSIFPLSLLYDGSCSVCRLELHSLKERDHGNRLRLIDIAQPDFDAAAWGASLAEMNALLHAVDARGVTHRGVAALRLAYSAVGLGWALRPTAWPLLAPAFDAAYRVFARHRIVMSKLLSPLLAPLLARQEMRQMVRIEKQMRRCHEGACAAPQSIQQQRGDPS
jgi:predicted DCC family thiol-disulfide oxidoreductase YuxK